MTLIRDKYSIVCYRGHDRLGISAFAGENQASRGESPESIVENKGQHDEQKPTRGGYPRSQACGEESSGLGFCQDETVLVETGISP
jgi:hypothetical protein